MALGTEAAAAEGLAEEEEPGEDGQRRLGGWMISGRRSVGAASNRRLGPVIFGCCEYIRMSDW